ncbi:MAG: hypothetical protein HYV33_03480 [Candidatus Kerfeldbacteria bacterium]|nr:hypothetical protein [Candidatus Kerfeldbacteria bacterium]
MLRLFSSYADPFEKIVDRFFKKISNRSNPRVVHQQLERLLQHNVVIVNLFMEKKFKNYRYLTTATRQRLYTNTQKLATAFDQFVQQYQVDANLFPKVFEQYQVGWQSNWTDQLRYLSAIMAFLKPGQRYQYIKSASFGKLLQDPANTILQGDCNQIVTLYTYLYARKFPITDLQAKVLPEHVCLHFHGIDIEATNATFTYYPSYDYLVQISELTAINLLDVSDFRENTAPISKKTLLKSAQLAYVISSLRDLVKRNLTVAYHNLTLYAVERHDYRNALLYAKTIRQKQLFTYVLQAQAAHYYNANQLGQARKLYQQLHDVKMIQATYQKEYNQLASRMPTTRTIADLKRYRSRYKKLLQIATKAGLTEQVNQIKSVLRQI